MEQDDVGEIEKGHVRPRNSLGLNTKSLQQAFHNHNGGTSI